MHELILHLIGDYVLQTEQMAVRKLHSWRWAIVHALVYSMPFFFYLGFINGSWTRGIKAWALIFVTHAVIDRMAVASIVCRIKNLVWFGADVPQKEPNTGYSVETPPYIRFWLMVIVDNTLHLCFNHIALNWLNS